MNDSLKHKKVSNKYDDIINLPHHVSSKHPHMSLLDRAAQFSPFAALTGHDAAIKETARLTDEQLELDESTIAIIDSQLQRLRAGIADRPQVAFTFFVPDELKLGGAYKTVSGIVKKIDEYERKIILEDGTVIRMDSLVAVEMERGFG